MVDDVTWYEDPDGQVACDTCNKLVHKWATGGDGYIVCEDCHALESVIPASC